MIPPVGRYLKEDAPKLFRANYGDAYGYKYKRKNDRDVLAYRSIGEGDTVLYWNGTALENVVVTEHDYWIGDFRKLAKRLVDMAGVINHPEPLILDLGAGTCMLSFALRDAGCSFPVLNIDLFQNVLALGQQISRRLELKGLVFGSFDLSKILDHPDSSSQLRTAILNVADGRPIIVVSRYAVYG
ncbi:MAG: hypothetical protein RLN85_17020, partial [Pseudomonadales bacterium]